MSAGVPYPSLSDTVPSVSTVPSTVPSPSASVKPASITSEIPSPSLSGSKWSGVPSLSVSQEAASELTGLTFNTSIVTPPQVPSYDQTAFNDIFAISKDAVKADA